MSDGGMGDRAALMEVVSTLTELAAIVRKQTEVTGIMLAGVRAIVPYLETHTEMLRKLMEMAGEEGEGSNAFQELLLRFELLMKQQAGDLTAIRLVLEGLPDQVEASAADGVRLAMGTAE